MALHPSLRNQLGQPTGYMPADIANYVPPGLRNQLGQPTGPAPTYGAGLGAGLRSGAATVAAAAGNAPVPSAPPSALGQMPSQLGFLNDPNLQALVKKLTESGQAAATSSLQAQADQATQRAEDEARMIQGFYSAGADLASRLSPYYQDVLQKSSNTLTGLAGAYGQSLDQLAPGQGAVFNELTGREPASRFDVQRTAVPFGPGARGDLFSVYGPTTSDIGSQTAAMRLSQGETERRDFERQLADLKAQAPGDYVKSLVSLAPLWQSQQQYELAKKGQQQQYGLAKGGQELTRQQLYGGTKGRPTLEARLGAQKYGLDVQQLALARGEAVGMVNGRLTVPAQQLQEQMRQYNKDFTLKFDEQGRLERQFQFTKQIQSAAETGMWNGNPTVDYQEALKADAQHDRALDLQQQGLISDTEAKTLDRNLATQIATWSHYRDLQAQGLQKDAQDALKTYQEGQLANQSYSLALQARGQNMTQANWKQNFEAQKELAAQSNTMNQFKMVAAEAASHNVAGGEHWAVRVNPFTGQWEAYQTGAMNPLTSAQTRGAKLPQGTLTPSNWGSLAKEMKTDASSSSKVFGVGPDGKPAYIPQPHTALSYDEMIAKYTQRLHNPDDYNRLVSTLDKMTNETGQRVYKRGGTTGRPLFSSESIGGPSEQQILANAGMSPAYTRAARSIMNEIKRDNPNKKWVNDASSGYSYLTTSTQGMKTLANGGVLSTDAIRSGPSAAVAPTQAETGSVPKGWFKKTGPFKTRDGVNRWIISNEKGQTRMWPPVSAGAYGAPIAEQMPGSYGA